MAAIMSGLCNASGVLAVICHVIYSTGFSKVGRGNAVMRQCGTLIIYCLMHDASLGLTDMRRILRRQRALSAAQSLPLMPSIFNIEHNAHRDDLITWYLIATIHKMSTSHAARCGCVSPSSGRSMPQRWRCLNIGGGKFPCSTTNNTRHQACAAINPHNQTPNNEWSEGCWPFSDASVVQVQYIYMTSATCCLAIYCHRMIGLAFSYIEWSSQS